jgi:superfamily I DNA/RNA helicase
MDVVSKTKTPELLNALWRDFEFEPNEEQRSAILHVDGPLFLPAGPGSGKTRVLLWRMVNLITTHGVLPEEIFLSTFTDNAFERSVRQDRRALRQCQTLRWNGSFTLSAFASRPQNVGASFTLKVAGIA